MAAQVSVSKESIVKSLLSNGYIQGAHDPDRLSLEQMVAAFKPCCDQPMQALCFYKQTADGFSYAVYHYCATCGKLEKLE